MTKLTKFQLDQLQFVLWVVMALTVIGTGMRVAFGRSPLDRLEQRARTYGTIDGGLRSPATNQFYWQAKDLEYVVSRMLNTPVRYVDPEQEGVLGTFNPHEQGIVVDARLSWDARLLILGHEAGHRLQPATLVGPDMEVFADAVSYLVARADGFDALELVGRHLAMYKSSLHVLTDQRKEILWAAELLTGVHQ